MIDFKHHSAIVVGGVGGSSNLFFFFYIGFVGAFKFRHNSMLKIQFPLCGTIRHFTFYLLPSVQEKKSLQPDFLNPKSGFIQVIPEAAGNDVGDEILGCRL